MKNFTKLLMLFLLTLGQITLAQVKKFNPHQGITLEHLSTYATGYFDQAASEISVYDPGSKRLFITNAEDESLDILDISDPWNPVEYKKLELEAGPNSVDVHHGIVAVAIEADPKQDPGHVVFFDVEGNYLNEVEVGALPDMLTFTPNGKYLLVANEAEPNDEYTNDPEGSVSIIDMRDLSIMTAGFSSFNGQKDALIDRGVRIFGPGATVAQDFEPEYITVDKSSKTAWVALQENNAIASIDIVKGEVMEIFPLGYKDYSLSRNAIDASNRDGRINITTWPVKGMYQPDGIGYFSYRGEDYIVTADEGDSRDYEGFSEEDRVKDLTLDSKAFPDADELQKDENLGRLLVTNTLGDTDGDGDYDELYSFGARSFSIWNNRGELVFDSGKDFEEITAQLIPDDFNSNNDENGSFDSRSDDKGPEPEGIVIGQMGPRTLAFICLERVGGVMIYDISNPMMPEYLNYVNNRDFSGDAEAGTAGDLGPEAMVFVPVGKSPINDPLLIVTNEVSGTTSLFAVRTEAPSMIASNNSLEVNAFPNPVVDQVQIQFPESITGKVEIEITGSFNGKSYLKSSGMLGGNQNAFNLNLSSLPSNLYVVKVSYGSEVSHLNLIKK